MARLFCISSVLWHHIVMQILKQWIGKKKGGNQGSRKFEDKLKKITLAYSQLKMTIGKKKWQI